MIHAAMGLLLLLTREWASLGPSHCSSTCLGKAFLLKLCGGSERSFSDTQLLRSVAVSLPCPVCSAPPAMYTSRHTLLVGWERAAKWARVVLMPSRFGFCVPCVPH